MTNAERAAVVDASVAAKWRLNDEELVDEAGLLLDQHLAGGMILLAPSLIRYELANTFEQARRAGRISEHDVIIAMRDFFAFRIHAPDDSDALIESASRVAARLGLSVYDATYVAFAEELGVTLVTNDREILQAAGGHQISACALEEVRSIL